MNARASTLAIVVSLAATACTTSPTPTIAPGSWGGLHLTMQVTSTGARLEYDCAEGAIEEPLRPDADGRFTVTGSHTPGHGGPIRVGEVRPVLRTRFEGRVDREEMSLLVTLIESGVQVGSFHLRHGSSGVLLRCL